MIDFLVGVGAGLLAGWIVGWAVTSWWHDRERPADPPWWWKPWLRFRRGDEDEPWPEHLEAALLEDRPPLPPERSREELGFTALAAEMERRLVPAPPGLAPLVQEILGHATTEEAAESIYRKMKAA